MGAGLGAGTGDVHHLGEGTAEELPVPPPSRRVRSPLFYKERRGGEHRDLFYFILFYDFFFRGKTDSPCRFVGGKGVFATKRKLYGVRLDFG